MILGFVLAPQIQILATPLTSSVPGDANHHDRHLLWDSGTPAVLDSPRQLRPLCRSPGGTAMRPAADQALRLHPPQIRRGHHHL